MVEPWFDANHWAWLPGTLLGCMGGLWGSLVGILVPQRKGQSVVYGFSFLLAGLATALAIVGLFGLASGQPFAVWFFLAVPALPLAVLSFAALYYLPKMYRFVEEQHTGPKISQ